MGEHLSMTMSMMPIGEKESRPFSEEPEKAISVLSALQVCTWACLHYALNTAGRRVATGQES